MQDQTFIWIMRMSRLIRRRVKLAQGLILLHHAVLTAWHTPALSGVTCGQTQDGLRLDTALVLPVF